MGYPKQVQEHFQKLSLINTKVVKEVSVVLKNLIDQAGIVYVFGSGHSCILALEAFHRAGGLVPVYPILHEFLSPFVSPKISGKLEKVEGIAPVLFSRAGVKKGDLMFIASNSGINAVPVEMALECKKAEVVTVALTSLLHSQKSQSKHSSQKKLFEICDYVLDNACPPGDALVTIGDVSVAAGSSIACSFLYHWILTESCKLWFHEGKKLPVYKSANLEGSEAYNLKMEEHYRQRIPLL